MELILLVPVSLPIITGFLCVLIPRQRLREAVALFMMFLTTLFSLRIFLYPELRLQMEWIQFSFLKIDFDLIAYPFSGFILLACSFFGLIITLYSIIQMREHARLKEYYIYLLWTVGFANGAILYNNIIVLLIFWSIISLMLYLLINISGERAENAAIKSLIIVGGSDFFMLIGIVIIGHLSGTLTMSEITLPIRDGLSTLVFIFLLIGVIAKAGAVPLHGWIPDAAVTAHTTVMAFLPAALDKLLGIYLLTRIVLDFFVMNFEMKILLMIVGSVTIITAVMMALVQKDLNRLLSFHAISQVGYMVLGIGSGTLIGIAGGLFHMLNHAIYKCCLFLCSGSVKYRTKTTDIEKLGGLARSMPVTFITCSIAALSISGIPPLNGFVSKWMVYQGIIDSGGSIWPLFLIAAMFGSALTLASFVKVIHSVFMGKKGREIGEAREVEFPMKVSMVILALLCVFFGIFAQFPLKQLIGPVIGMTFSGFGETINLSGIWSPTLATGLLILSLIIGFIFYRLTNIKAVKEGEPFVGGEPIDAEEIRISGTHFYDTIESTGFLVWFYKKGSERILDSVIWGEKCIKAITFILYHGIDRLIDRLYERIRIISLSLAGGLRRLHTGILTTYLIWFLFGLIVLFLIFM